MPMIPRIAVKHNHRRSACGELHIPSNFRTAVTRWKSEVIRTSSSVSWSAIISGLMKSEWDDASDFFKGRR